MPVEVIDVPTVVGSERHCAVWVNSPQIETRHLQFARDDGDWYVEDLGSTHGTFLGDQRITRRRVEDGDEYRLAGYLRLRTELR
jgi:pSer/pThr/pTyr-binding forkhead associated (FHA) protein